VTHVTRPIEGISMKSIRFLARPLAATAVAGLVLVGLGGTAGASTLSVSLPPVVGGVVGSDPVVAVGSGTVAPAPGADATVPAHGTSDVTVNDPTEGTVAPVAPVADQNGQLASGHASGDACIAVALLTGHNGDSCGRAAGSNPSLAGALSSVGSCVWLKMAAGVATDTCSATDPGAAISDSGGVSTVGDLQSDGSVASNGSQGSLGLQGAGLGDGTVKAALERNGLCTIAQQLGVSGLGTCSASSGAAIGAHGKAATGSHATTKARSAAQTRNLCLGLAAVSGLDASPCLHSAGGSAGTAHAAAKSNGAQGAVKARGHGTVSASGSAPNVLNGSCASSTIGARSTSPFSSEAAGGIAGLGLGLAALGRAIRKMRRPVLV
jgi:hypothetical protein